MKSLDINELELSFARYIKHLGGVGSMSRHQHTIIKASFMCGIASCIMILDKTGGLDKSSIAVRDLVDSLDESSPEKSN